MADNIWRCTGYDANGIRRCFGDGIWKDESFDQCVAEAMEYVRGRPDTGPLDKWTYKFEELPDLPEGD